MLEQIEQFSQTYTATSTVSSEEAKALARRVADDLERESWLEADN